MRSGRFIPFSRADLVALLESDDRLPVDDAGHFRALTRLLNATFHVEFRERLEKLKEAYAPFAHDPDTRTVRTYDTAERAQAQQDLLHGLEELLEHANFQRVDVEEIHRAFEEESLLKVRVEVDLDDFEHLLFFRRGETDRTREVSTWKGLRRKVVSFTNYEKVLVFVTFKDTEYFASRDIDVEELPFTPGSTVLKLFQDVPKADIESLFPNTQVKMRWADRLLIGIPAIISGIIIASTKLLTTIGLLILLAGFYLGIRDQPVELDQATLVTLGAGVGSFGGYLTRQFTKFKARRMEFLKTLADNLYFRNLDNDAGVFHNLLDAAEEEETKEAILGWYFLRAADHPLSMVELDRVVEGWFAERLDCVLDFDVTDGVEKLRRLELITGGDEHLTAVPADVALERLDARWDEVFTYNQARDSPAGGTTDSSPDTTPTGHRGS
ncbi:MAG: TMEM143 family protein [Nitriliruptoraceae bacterium]